VNVLGCLAIGGLGGLAEYRNLLDPATRLLLFTGFLGGFTTFSAFAYETYFLGREGAWASGAANVLLQVALGLFAVWLGHRLVAP
jgi:CrcB protein